MKYSIVKPIVIICAGFICYFVLFQCTPTVKRAGISQNNRLVVNYNQHNQKVIRKFSTEKTNIHKSLGIQNPQKKAISLIYLNRKNCSALFEQETERSISIDEVVLNVPKGAVSGSQELKICELLTEDLPEIPGEVINVTKTSAGYRFLPHGMLFDKPVSVSMAYDPALIPEGYTSSDIYTFYFDEKDGIWKALDRDSVDEHTNSIISHTLHFTDMINGILKVPESPATEGYVPTSLKDVKAADPSAGITQIAPPSANNKGEAEISFPLTLPKGRNGMQPNIEINYNSTGFSSWVGYGWEISIPNISVDGRWGVPRYDSLKESETYMLNGKELSPLAHRSEYKNRSSEKRFYERIEDNFSKIIRHGTNPDNYWWEVITTDGLRSYYGGNSSTGKLDTNAVSMDSKHRIFYWALTEMCDRYGNKVSYRYYNPQIYGQHLYPKEIYYTGYKNQTGPYKIEFILNENQNTFKRNDCRIDARMGTAQYDSILLRRINISFNNELIRSYGLHYATGAFYKTLLDEIIAYNNVGDEFYRHKFEYYDDIQSKNGYVPYDTLKVFHPVNDHLADGIKTNVLTDYIDLSLLGSSVSWGFTAGAAGSFGFDPNVASKSTSLGGNGNYIRSEATGIVSLIDINGDGAPDKVFKYGDSIYYRPNLGTDNDSLFGEKKVIKGIGNINYSVTSGSGGGPELNLPGFIFLGYNHTDLKTEVQEYFNDFNSDGLVDFVKNGRIYYNHINSKGDPEFTATSQYTPNPLKAKSVIISSSKVDSIHVQDSLVNQFPLLDAVRMWKAPYQGLIKIHAPVALIRDPVNELKADTLDGVIVSLQKSKSIIWDTAIMYGNFDTIPLDTTLFIKKDSCIYFRLQSVFNGLCDKVHWDPQIEYLNIDGDDSLPKIKDANRNQFGLFKASKDFLLCGAQSVVIPDSGTISIKTKFSKPFTTDSIILEIIQSDTSNKEIIYKSLTYDSHRANGNIEYLNIPVFKNDYYIFRVKSLTNIDWTKIKWEIQVEFTKKGKTKPSYTFNTYPEFKFLYVNVLSLNYPLITDTSFYRKYYHQIKDTLRPVWISPKLNNITDSFVFSVKTRDSLLLKRKYPQNKTPLHPEAFRLDIKRNDTLFFDYHSYNVLNKPNPDVWIKFGDSISIQDTVFIKDTIALTIDTIINIRDTLVFYDSLKYAPSIYNKIETSNQIFGSLYRGWGQFTYNGNPDRDHIALYEDSLRLNINENSKKDYSGYDSSSLKNIPQPLEAVFSMMVPYVNRGLYIGIDTLVYISSDIMSSTRKGEKNILYRPENFSGLELVGYSKTMEDISDAGSGGVSAPAANLSYSACWGNGNVTRDMMDMNGDGYPDLITPNQIQYTGMLGALINQLSYPAYGGHNSRSYASGWASGGNFVYAKNSNSTNTSNSKLSKASNNNLKNSKNANSAEQTSKSTLGATISPTANLNTSNDSVNITMLDINGDGLPDKITQQNTVQLNLGYSFDVEKPWNFQNIIQKGQTFDYSLGAGLGLNYGDNSITGGFSISKSDNESKSALMDITGDGLPDLIKSTSNSVIVYINTGTGFLGPINWSNYFSTFDKGVSYGGAVNSGFTVGVAFIIFGFPFKFCVSPGGSYSQGLSSTKTQLMDLNGDGMPDYVLSDNESNISAYLSTLHRTNLLKKVNLPLGGNFELNYEETPATYDHPGGAIAMASVKIFDGLPGDGIDSSFVSIEYDSGYYDRHQKEFYGFASVKIHFLDVAQQNKIYRSQNQHFYNRNYFFKGKMYAEELTDEAGNRQTGIKNSFSLRNISNGQIYSDDEMDSVRLFVALDQVEHDIYGGTPEPQIRTSTTYEYDSLGNVIKYIDYASGNSKDKIEVHIKYHTNSEKYLYTIPSEQLIINQDNIIRRRESVIDSVGNIVQIKQYYTSDQYARYRMEYDEYGNISKLIHPGNYNNEHLWYSYVYDSITHTFITKVSNAYGYYSSASYNYLWSTRESTTDINKQSTLYHFDNFGRMDKITGPNEIAGGKDYTITFEYHPDAKVPYSRTLHYDSLYNHIETYTFTDGLNRVVQIKKSASLFDNPDNIDLHGYIVSGRNEYDAFGRIIKLYQPIFEDTIHPAEYSIVYDNIKPIVSSYDILDRPLRVELPDNSVTTHSYGIALFDGENMMVDTLTDALKHQMIKFTDSRKQIVTNITKSVQGDVIDSLKYNALGELISITNPKGLKTQYKYDLLGRKLSAYQPEMGLIEYEYDTTGNLVKKITANLRKQIPNKGAIIYHYDKERLSEIIYPRNTQNRVNYIYGDTNAKHNRIGRLVLVQDASGGQEFFYGRLGEVIKTIRTVQLGESDMRTWIWSAGYDSWNRIQTMDYPDGEKVKYYYNRAGNLLKMEGQKSGRIYNYINRIGYDKYDRRKYLEYGDSTSAYFNYDPLRQRLDQMRILSNNTEIVNNNYRYDELNNILSINNSANISGNIGGSTSYTYSYDDLNRLIKSSGNFTGNKENKGFEMTMSYDIMGNITRKTMTNSGNSKDQSSKDYDIIYRYNSLRANCISTLGEKKYTYDENGNQTFYEDTVTNDFRQCIWDEENRLIMISDNGYINRYVYDANGERVLKSHGGSQGVYINSAPVGVINHSDINYTVYVSPYFVLRNNEFTKHYYIENTRVVSKIGNGRFANQFRPGVFEITAGKVNYINRQQQISKKVEDDEAASKVPPGPPTMKGVYSDPLYSGTAYSDLGKFDTVAPIGWPKKPIIPSESNPPGAPVQWGNDITNDNVEAGFGFLGNGNIAEELQYFYHSDHLGNTNLITNSKGDITQYISYMPFGETFVEQHSKWNSPYKFNGKESDEETGLYYYGPRYYDPKGGFWLSVDPNAEKYVCQSPYVYCMDNPVKYIDVNGKDGDVEIIGNEIKIKVEIFIYGNAASDAKATGIQTTIMDNWNKGLQYTDPITRKNYTVSFDVKVKFDASANPDNIEYMKSHQNVIEIVQNEGESSIGTSYVSGGRKGQWVDKQKLHSGEATPTWDPSAHEFGHLIGLTDQYNDAGPKSGWEGNMMATRGGQVTQKNIDILGRKILEMRPDKEKNKKFNTKIKERNPRW